MPWKHHACSDLFHEPLIDLSASLICVSPNCVPVTTMDFLYGAIVSLACASTDGFGGGFSGFGVPGGATSEPSAFTTSSRFSSGKIQPSSVLFHWPPPIALSSSFLAKVSPLTRTQEPTWMDIFAVVSRVNYGGFGAKAEAVRDGGGSGARRRRRR